MLPSITLTRIDVEIKFTCGKFCLTYGEIKLSIAPRLINASSPFVKFFVTCTFTMSLAGSIVNLGSSFLLAQWSLS